MNVLVSAIHCLILHLTADSDSDGGTTRDQVHLNCREGLAVFILVSVPLNIYCKFKRATRPAEMDVQHSHSYLRKEEGAFKHQCGQLLIETALIRQRAVSSQSLILSSTEINFVACSVASFLSPEKHKLKKPSNKTQCTSRS